MNIKKEDIGRKVWDFNYGWGEIVNFSNGQHPVDVKFIKYQATYVIGGREFETRNQSLFWDELKFDIPEKPKIMVKKTVEAWANVYPGGDIRCTYTNKRDADFSADNLRIACVKLNGEYEVGEG